MTRLFSFFFSFGLGLVGLSALAGPCDQGGIPAKTVTQSAVIQGKVALYDVSVGFTPVTDGANPQGCLFSTMYKLKSWGGVAADPERPLSFLMNGGPGSSSSTIQFAGLGPKRLNLGATGTDTSQGSSLMDNNNSLLVASDLVFIDPMGTGYSFVRPGHSLNDFLGVNKDAASIAQFIRVFLNSQSNPLVSFYIVGESYNGIRVPAVAKLLVDMLTLKGLVLISPYLEGTANENQETNSLSIAMKLPSFAATAWYYHLLSPALQSLFK